MNNGKYIERSAARRSVLYDDSRMGYVIDRVPDAQVVSWEYLMEFVKKHPQYYARQFVEEARKECGM